MTKTTKFLASIIICQGAGLIGSFFTVPEIKTWYSFLIKPSFNPPSWIFGPVWTLLFLLMGISLYLVWDKNFGGKSQTVILAFGAQLVYNIFWSVIFFGLRDPLFAFVDIIILWVAILHTIFVFNKISKLASWLLVPYLLWVSFAGVLNFYILALNS